jgi:hypothetical protein
MGWPLGQFVALKRLSATKSDSISGHYVSQCVALASDRVAQSVYEGTDDPPFAANFAVNKRRIHRNR